MKRPTPENPRRGQFPSLASANSEFYERERGALPSGSGHEAALIDLMFEDPSQLAAGLDHFFTKLLAERPGDELELAARSRLNSPSADVDVLPVGAGT